MIKIELSSMVKNIRPSLMFRFLEKAKEMEREGIEIIHLEKGEPEFGPPKGAIDEAKKAMDEGYNILTPSSGIKELREAIAEDLKMEFDLEVDPEKEVVIVPGAKFGVFASIGSIIMPDDEVLCLSPFFPPHREIIEMLGGKFIQVPLLEEGECKLNIDKFKKKLTNRTRILLLSYPHNPTGWVPTDEDIEILLELVEKKGLIIVSDEVYDRIIFNGLKHRPFFGFNNLKGQLILVNSFSKRFAMTGWRIGYCIGPSHIINGIVRIQQNITTCAHSASQRAAVFALKEEKSYSEMLARVYGERKDLILGKLQKIPGLRPIPPKGALFIFISISKLSISSTQFVDEFLDEEHVAITPGLAFGEDWDQYIRISMTEDPSKISVALDRLKRFVEKRI